MNTDEQANGGEEALGGESPPAPEVSVPEAPLEVPATEAAFEEEPAARAAAPPDGSARESEEGAPGGAERPRPAGDDRRRRHFGRRKVCAFCVEHAQSIDYKDAAKLRRYLSDRARIDARRKTGTCAKHQRWLAQALKRARHLALLPYSAEHIRTTGMFTGRR